MPQQYGGSPVAAEQGLTLAQAKLGLMYENGHGVPQDYVATHMWYDLAVARGQETARNVQDNHWVMEPEFAWTLRVMARDSNTLSAVVRQAWDDGNLRIVTKTSPARATGAHIGWDHPSDNCSRQYQ